MARVLHSFVSRVSRRRPVTVVHCRQQPVLDPLKYPHPPPIVGKRDFNTQNHYRSALTQHDPAATHLISHE